jgi:protein-L-isoaspartate(D-aspartate) O-methyltransferase
MNKNSLIKHWKENYDFTDLELNAFEEIERELFVIQELEEVAYQDTPLPILRGKTISQPSTVMIMTHALELKKGERVFEVGTGSGYQTAIISRLVGSTGKIFTTEVIPELLNFAKNNLLNSNINNFEIFEEDGSKGLKQQAKFDKIIITAACNDFPEELIEQLRVGGIIVGPVGNKDEQKMIKAIKKDDNSLEYDVLGPFLFSPLYGKYGFEV